MFNLFSLNSQTGLVCKNKTISNSELSKLIIESPLKYTDELQNICYNLYLLASKTANISLNQLKIIQYDISNCSFNYFKICLGQSESIVDKLKFAPQNCKAGKFKS